MSDPYYDWLGIPQHQRPVTHYQLLGIPSSEFNRDVIEAAALRRMLLVRAQQNGPHGAEASRILQELMTARDTLIDTQRRRIYDATSPDAVAWWQGGTPSANESVPPPIVAPLPPMPAPAPAPTPVVAGEPWWKESAPATTEVAPPAAPTSAGAGWWQGAAPMPEYTPPASAPLPVAAMAPTYPPPIYQPLSTPSFPTQAAPPLGSPGSFGAPAATMPVAPAPYPGAHPATELGGFDEFAPARRRRQSGNGLIMAFGLLLLLGGGGAVVYFAMNKAAVSPTPPVEVVERPKEKEPDPPEITKVIPPKPKVTPKKETVRPVPKKESPKDDPEKMVPPKKETPKDPPMPTEDVSKPRQYKGFDGGVPAVAVSPDAATVLAVGEDKNVNSWSLAGEGPNRHHQLMSPGVAVAYLPGKKEFVVCDGGSIFVIDPASNTVRSKMTNPRGGIQCLTPDADGVHVLAGATDGTLRWWNTSGNQLERTFDVSDNQPVTAVAVSRDGKTAVAGTQDGNISTWNLVMGKLIRKWKGHGGAVTALHFDPESKRILSTGADRVGAIWGADSGKMVVKLGAHDGVPLAAVWSSDGKRAVTCGVDKNVRVWDTNSGKALESPGFASGKVYALAIDPQDRFVLAATSQGVVDRLPLAAMKPSTD